MAGFRDGSLGLGQVVGGRAHADEDASQRAKDRGPASAHINLVVPKLPGDEGDDVREIAFLPQFASVQDQSGSMNDKLAVELFTLHSAPHYRAVVIQRRSA
jgi:hypothetical protein